MEKVFWPDIPRTLEAVCEPRRMALLVYDMQVGIVSQLPHGPEVTARVGEVLSAAREGGFRVFFSRHTSLPKELMGASSSGRRWPGNESTRWRMPYFPSLPGPRRPR
jgi:nicotinamidase-related amidase